MPQHCAPQRVTSRRGSCSGYRQHALGHAIFSDQNGSLLSAHSTEPKVQLLSATVEESTRAQVLIWHPPARISEARVDCSISVLANSRLRQIALFNACERAQHRLKVGQRLVGTTTFVE
jgi:hypothetical protein